MNDDRCIKDMIESVDIVEYISQFVELQIRDDGEYWGISCLSDHDTDPSFSVNKEQQIFYDFSSHAGGNVLNFIKSYNRCSTGAAIEILSCYISEHGGSPQQTATRRLNCAKVIRKFMPPHRRVKDAKYQKLAPDYMDMFPFDAGKLSPWIEEGISEETLRKWSVRYDHMSGRIVFPIKDVDGNIINVCGRTTDPDYKQKKLRKYTYFFPLGRFDTLYGFSEHRSSILKKGEVIVFEGAKSVMLSDEWGVDNSVAICTSHINIHQFFILLKLGVRVVFALDTDVNIYADENIMRLKRYVRLENVINRDGLLGEKMSPVDAGKEVWDTLYERRSVVR